jgi:hypothetical protein
MTAPAAKSWRNVIAIHPAAELFPRMSEPELRELGEDIKRNGMTSPIVLFREPIDPAEPKHGHRYSLLDGISRLDAMELIGVPFSLHQEHNGKFRWTLGNDPLPDRTIVEGIDPFAYVCRSTRPGNTKPRWPSRVSGCARRLRGCSRHSAEPTMTTKLKRTTLPPKAAELARCFFRVCQQTFGDGCTVVVRHKPPTTDAARRVPRGQHLTQPST